MSLPLEVCLAVWFERLFHSQRKEKRPPRWWSRNRGIRAEHEDFRALRLLSKLPDLRAGNANPARFASCGENPLFPSQNEKSTAFAVLRSGRGIGIRTPTYRVRVCCAAVTQFPCARTDYIFAHNIRFVKCFF